METTIIEKRALNIKETAETLGLSPNKIRRMLKNHEIAAVRAGDRWLVPIKSIEAYLDKAKCGA